MQQAVTLEQVLKAAKQLSLVDKVRLIERVAPEIERELKTPRYVGGCYALDTSSRSIP